MSYYLLTIDQDFHCKMIVFLVRTSKNVDKMIKLCIVNSSKSQQLAKSTMNKMTKNATK